jgi:hypothetical protein
MVAEVGRSSSGSVLTDVAIFVSIAIITILFGMFLRTTCNISYAAPAIFGAIAIFGAFRVRRRKPIARSIIWSIVAVYSGVALLFALMATGIATNGGL